MTSPPKAHQWTAAEFLQQSSEMRQEILRLLGLTRYADILTQLSITEGNLVCVERFLSRPESVKFPQLQRTDLSTLQLPGCNLIRGDLSGANCRGTNFRDGDLLFVRAIQADFREADLRGATLSRSVWTDALVKGCLFGMGNGLSSRQIENLQFRGAVFE